LHSEVLEAESPETEKEEICCRATQEYPFRLTTAPEEERQRGNLLVSGVPVLDHESLGSLAVNRNIQAGGFRAEPAFPTEERDMPFFTTQRPMGAVEQPYNSGLCEMKSEPQRLSCKAKPQQDFAYASCLRGLEAQGPTHRVLYSSSRS